MNSFLLILNDSKFNADDPLISHISIKRQGKISQYLFDIDKKLSLYSELTLRMGLSEMLEENPDSFQFGSKGNNKPYILNQPNIFFNLSHTKNALLCSISNISEIGVDIEKIQKIDYKLLNYIAHPDEKQSFQIVSSSHHDLLFYHIWTRKEAYCKRTGIGILQKLTTINTTICEPSKQYFTWQINNYICSIYCNNNEQNHIKYINEEDVRKYFISYS